MIPQHYKLTRVIKKDDWPQNLPNEMILALQEWDKHGIASLENVHACFDQVKDVYLLCCWGPVKEQPDASHP